MTESLFPAGAALVLGATGGLGRAATVELAKSGSDIAICYRSKQTAAEELAAELRALGRNVTIHAADATDAASLQAAVETAVAVHGRVHTLVWAAGPLVDQMHLADTPHERWKQAIDVEVHGFFLATRSILPHFRAAGGGSFVHLGSAGHLLWPERDGLSVAPKAANEALIRGIAREEGRHNIRANSVLVGVIDAGMFHELLAKGYFDDNWAAEVQKALCLKRWGHAEEIGHAVVFLASNKAGYTTGQQIAVAGGYGV